MELCYQNDKLRGAVRAICLAVKSAGGVVRAVGGCVRDSALGLPAKDIDLEVYHIRPDELTGLLAGLFPVNLVGQSFGVVKIQGLPIDVAIPRRESKSGSGHRGFHVYSDPDMDPREAAARRDFTMNAIALDPLGGELIDPFNGLADLRAGLLRHTGPQFAEDPLRVLRAMQFAARFVMRVAPETVGMCRRITPEGLPPERIFDEWRKLVRGGEKPSLGLGFLRDCGWVNYYPGLAALIGCPQEPRWHPEGDVWNHTLLSMDAFARERTGDEHEDLVVGFAVLCHDFGKPLATQQAEDFVRAHGHDLAAEEPVRAFLAQMTRQRSFIDEVIALVVHHMRPHQLYTSGASDSAIRRLAGKVGRIDRLVRVDRADRQGRMPAGGQADMSCPEWLTERARALAVEEAAPTPLLLGRHLIGLGLRPGTHFKPLLDACYQAQLAGGVTSEETALDFARAYLEKQDAGQSGLYVAADNVSARAKREN